MAVVLEVAGRIPVAIEEGQGVIRAVPGVLMPMQIEEEVCRFYA